MDGNEAVQCHTCGDHVSLARSVNIRRFPVETTQTLQGTARWGVGRPGDPASGWRELGHEIQEHVRRISYHRHHVCEACYTKLDSGGGSSDIQRRDGTRQCWCIAVECRDGRAERMPTGGNVTLRA